jgi:hypothetical protein
LKKSNKDNLLLHWGINLSDKSDWIAPDEKNCVTNTEWKKFDNKAVQNLFDEENNLELEIKSNKENKITGFTFVFNNTSNVNI